MTHRNNIRAFTLIELLVVIAIIAILAAILFPVFAQAKVAAKGAASISNDKQIITAAMLYMGDFDDRPPLVGILGEPDSPFLLNGTLYKPWSYQMLPYMKAGIVFQDPLRKAEPPIAGAPADALWAYRTHFGYAWTVHCPVTFGSGGWLQGPVQQTTIADPANTVMFPSKKGRDSTRDWLYVGSPIWMANLVAPVYCASSGYTQVEPNSICAPNVRWGSDGYAAGEAPTEIEGLYTGGTALRKTNQAIVAYSDGHVKSSTAGRLAAGTNWSKTTRSSAIRITDKALYQWDIE